MHASHAVNDITKKFYLKHSDTKQLVLVKLPIMQHIEKERDRARDKGRVSICGHELLDDPSHFPATQKLTTNNQKINENIQNGRELQPSEAYIEYIEYIEYIHLTTRN